MEIHTSKLLYIGRRIMRGDKLGFIAALLAVWFLQKPANAFMGFDPGEMIPIPKQASNAISKLDEVKSSIQQLKEAKDAIGDEVNGFAEFAKDISVDPENLKIAANNINNKVKNNVDNIITAQNKINDVLSFAKKTQEDLADEIVQATEQTSSLSESPTQVRENLDIKFTDIKAVGMQLATGVNDVFDTALNTLNQNAENNHNRLETLNARMAANKKIGESAKKTLLAQDLKSLEQETSDTGISIIEKAHTQYNKDYKENFSDELNNYHKVVLAYANGSADKSAVVNAGKQFKLAVSNINSNMDAAVIEAYKKQASTFKGKLDATTKNIIQHLEKESDVRRI